MTTSFPLAPIIPALFFLIFYKFIPNVIVPKNRADSLNNLYDLEDKNALQANEQTRMLHRINSHDSEMLTVKNSSETCTNSSSSDPDAINVYISVAVPSHEKSPSAQTTNNYASNHKINTYNKQQDVENYTNNTAPIYFGLEKHILAAMIYSNVMVLLCVYQGVGEIMQYGKMIVENFNLTETITELIVVGISVIFVMLTLIAFVTVNYFSRKTQALMNSVGGLVCSILVLFLNQFTASEAENQQQASVATSSELLAEAPGPNIYQYLIVIPLLIHVASYTIGLGNVFWLIPSEITPKNSIGLVQSVQVSLYYITTSISAFFFPLLDDALGPNVFVIFVITNTLGCLYIHFRGVESRNRNLMDIIHELNQRPGVF